MGSTGARVWLTIGRRGLQAWDCGSVAPSVCSLVGETYLEAGTGFLEVRPGAFPLVGRAGSWACGVRALYSSMSGEGCGLRKSLGILCAIG